MTAEQAAAAAGKAGRGRAMCGRTIPVEGLTTLSESSTGLSMSGLAVEMAR